MVADVVHPIIGRDFFDGPGRNIVLDPLNRSYSARSITASLTPGTDSSFQCAKTTVPLNPGAEPFFPSEPTEDNCTREAKQLVTEYINYFQDVPCSSPALFSPIRIDTGNNAPVFSKARPLFGEKAEAVKDILKSLVEKQIIEPVNDCVEWASPIHVVPKDGN
ncbi:Hypothetical predicted protein, partial [Paramuricea clavata]